MKPTLVAIAIACLADCVLSNQEASVSRVPGKKRFKLNEIHNKHFKGHNIPAAFLRTHLKYGSSLPPPLSRALKINPSLKSKYTSTTLYSNNTAQKGSVKTHAPPKFDSEFAVPVDIGTPPQTIPLNLDTGTADLWTFSSETNRQFIHGQALYHPENSSTSKLQSHQSWQIEYGDGDSASGIVYKDRVALGTTFVDQQTVQAAITVSPHISNNNFTSGILGMANSRGNAIRPTQGKTYIDNVRAQLEKPVFTANLRNRGPGNYNFGFINRSEYTGEIQYAAINSSSPFWEVTIGGYTIGKGGGGDFKKRVWNAIIDTGTSLLLLPDDIVSAYYSQIPDAAFDVKMGVMVFPCNADIPDFTFGIGPHRGRVPGEYIKYGPIDDTYCHGGIQSASGIPFAVFGAVALKAQFVVFNYERGIVGFANKKL
ncbi:hypothetical protein HIM_10543 [Hirsutella minnesotensis 3608]|uniref:Peptidase A1 domain-containing protein n=1 Tax=Hirsutella minnesotensis 3608 TaxID=1043627 RepID=A0A0F7ZJY3_9HYPO|nr:hypothetical protein HIM_10543 [Hirsutella minnesotensis 3608]